MQQIDALAEMISYFAGALDDGQIDAARIDGAMLRRLVDVARGMRADAPIGAVWTQTHNVIAAAWRHQAPEGIDK